MDPHSTSTELYYITGILLGCVQLCWRNRNLATSDFLFKQAFCQWTAHLVGIYGQTPDPFTRIPLCPVQHPIQPFFFFFLLSFHAGGLWIIYSQTCCCLLCTNKETHLLVIIINMLMQDDDSRPKEIDETNVSHDPGAAATVGKCHFAIVGF